MAEILKQFRTGSLLSYGIADLATRQCAIIDPVAEAMDEYRAFLIDRDLRLTALFETVSPPTRRSAAEQFRREFKLPETAIPSSLGSPGPFQVRSGSKPGSFHVSCGGFLFSGDDWRLASGVELPAWMSTLSDQTILLPAQEQWGLLFSTVGIEKSRIGREPMDDSARVPEISVSKFQLKLKEAAPGNVFIDVREASEFASGHIPGMMSLPLSELVGRWSELTPAKRIYVSCLSGRRGQQAAQTLDYLGFRDVVNLVGGFHAWSQAGQPVEAP